MALSPATSQKLGNWFANYLQPKDGGSVASYFDDQGSAFNPSGAASSNTATSKTSGLLASSSTPATPEMASGTTGTATTPATTKSTAGTTPTSATTQPAPAGAPQNATEANANLLKGLLGSPPTGTNPIGRGPVTAPGGGPNQNTKETATDTANTPAATVPTTPAKPASTPLSTTAAQQAASGVSTDQNGVATLNLNDLTQRTVGPNETVQQQIDNLLDENGKYIQTARDQAQRQANSRGLLNSSIAAGAGEEAAIQSALPIAQSDAATYSKVADYNASLMNQARMYNADAWNKMSLDQKDNAVQLEISKMQTDASEANAAEAAAASTYSAQLQANASKYATDTQARTAADHDAAVTYQQQQQQNATAAQQAQHDHESLVNNILTDDNIPPERRAAMLRALGEDALADGIFVVDSTTPDLNGPGT